ncbi:MAG: DNA alkylation repair protein [Verrucomicrobia bacterium]|nr:DNA alkylation repair protein [Verrucomicrobiota bacterium]
MTVRQVMKELASYGSEQTKRIYFTHGASEPLFGVKIGDMKKLLKKVDSNNQMALGLFDTGNADARYFAALMADESGMTKANLRKWARASNWQMLSEYAVAQLISETKHGWDLGIEFIDAKKENVACCGWSTLSNWVSFRPVNEVDISAVAGLLERLESTIHDQANRLRFTMCNFVVAAGAYVPEVTKQTLAIGKRLKDLEIEPVKKGCSVPEIVEDLTKIQKMGRIGRKRKRARC